MRKSIATVSVGGTLTEKLEAIAAARFAGVELFDADLTSSPWSAEEVAARCADLGLGIDLFQPLRDIVGMRPRAFADRLRFARAKFDVMERLGATRVLVCSAVHPDAAPEPDLTAEQLHALGEVAADQGFSVAFEALAWGSHVNRVEQAWRAVEAAGHPAVGLAVDTFHLLARGDDGSALAGVPGDRMAYLQVADAPYLSMDVLEWSRHHRCFPGQGSMDVVGVVAAVVEAGYRGPLSLEVFSDIVREAEPHDTARDGMRSLLYLEEQLRRHWAEAGPTTRGGGTHTRPAVELFDPPAEPARPVPAYVEVTADAGSGAVAGLFRSLGFRPEDGSDGRTWWQQGGARLLMTTADRADRADRPAVTAVGLDVDDPDRFFARAEALQWGPVTGSTGGAVSVTSPTGVRVDVAAANAAAVGPPATNGWHGVDHVGAAVDVDRSDAEVSFYRTLFGLRPGPVSEFFDPSGRLRSRVLEPPAGGLRMVLNIVVRAGGRAQTGVNQVAFACDDLLGRVEQMRVDGAPLLEVPGGYYDDLTARFDLDPRLLERLRGLGVLYDRDDRGELLHAYTPMVGGRFYVEVLERRGGYTGFGAPNTPVRLALQAAAPWVV